MDLSQEWKSDLSQPQIQRLRVARVSYVGVQARHMGKHLHIGKKPSFNSQL